MPVGVMIDVSFYTHDDNAIYRRSQLLSFLMRMLGVGLGTNVREVRNSCNHKRSEL